VQPGRSVLVFYPRVGGSGSGAASGSHDRVGHSAVVLQFDQRTCKALLFFPGPSPLGHLGHPGDQDHSGGRWKPEYDWVVLKRETRAASLNTFRFNKKAAANRRKTWALLTCAPATAEQLHNMMTLIPKKAINPKSQGARQLQRQGHRSQTAENA
jgi:hypothetical protein